MIKIYFDVVTDPIPKLYESLMKRVIRAVVCEHYPKHRFEVNVTVCDDEEIRVINNEQRGINRSTDVLSFPFLDFDTPDTLTMLGDIIISRDTAYRQAKEYGHSPKREFCFLAAQGGCEPQLTSHAAGNMMVGNDKAFLIRVISQCLPYIGYPRSLNALACVNKAAEQFK